MTSFFPVARAVLQPTRRFPDPEELFSSEMAKLENRLYRQPDTWLRSIQPVDSFPSPAQIQRSGGSELLLTEEDQ